MLSPFFLLPFLLLPHRPDAIEQCAVGAEQVEEIGLKRRGRIVGEEGHPIVTSGANTPAPLQELPGGAAALPFEAEAVGFGDDAGKAQHGAR